METPEYDTAMAESMLSVISHLPTLLPSRCISLWASNSAGEDASWRQQNPDLSGDQRIGDLARVVRPHLAGLSAVVAELCMLDETAPKMAETIYGRQIAAGHVVFKHLVRAQACPALRAGYRMFDTGYASVRVERGIVPSNSTIKEYIAGACTALMLNTLIEVPNRPPTSSAMQVGPCHWFALARYLMAIRLPAASAL